MDLIAKVSSELIYNDRVMLATEVVSDSPLFIATAMPGTKRLLDVAKNPIFQSYVQRAEGFMNTPISDDLKAIIEA